VRTTDVRVADWYGEDLSGREHTGARFSGVDLSETTGDGADLRGSDLTAVDPRRTELAGARIDVTQAVVLVTALGPDVRPDAPE
jgi:fluoroquinolone resistance protein